LAFLFYIKLIFEALIKWSTVVSKHSFSPVGWGIGAGVLIYGGATMIYDAYNDKK